VLLVFETLFILLTSRKFVYLRFFASSIAMYGKVVRHIREMCKRAIAVVADMTLAIAIVYNCRSWLVWEVNSRSLMSFKLFCGLT